MKIYGYQQEQEDLLKLEEVSLQCTIEELDKILDFIIEVKKKHSAVAEKTDMCHSHFRDWDSAWEQGQPDIIIVTKFLDK